MRWLAALLLVLVIASTAAAVRRGTGNMLYGTARTVIHSGDYTFAEVELWNDVRWVRGLRVPKMKVGSRVRFRDGAPLFNIAVKEINRSFYFLTLAEMEMVEEEQPAEPVYRGKGDDGSLVFSDNPVGAAPRRNRR